MRPDERLTWIHVSDLHFGHGKEAEERFDQKVVTDKIVEDARVVAAELGPPDVVFVTGDVAFSAGAEKEYPAAAAWLGKLVQALGIGKDRVLVVPGNHDVDRRKAGERLSGLAHHGLRADPDKVNDLLEHTSKMEGIWPKLTAFQKFAAAFGSPEITPERPFWTHEIPSGLGRVVAVGLNTALLSFDGHDSRDNLALGIGQLHRAFEGVDPRALVFVLQHHPPGWLRDGQDLLAWLKGRPHLLLCGHVHEQRGFITLPLASRGNTELVAGAGHKDAGEAGNHAYAWGRIGAEGLEYYPRAWFKDEMLFTDQRIHPPEDQKGYSEKLGKFARYPRTKLPEALEKWLESRVSPASIGPSTDTVSGPATFRGAVVEAAPTAADFDPARAHFYVPYKAKREQVVGREDALRKVREQLESGRPTAIGQTAAFVGLGGLGKTQLAVEYAHAYRDRYPGGVYWFNADGDLDAQISLLAVDARWVSPLSEARATLEIARYQIRHRSGCLIVFDNVEDVAAIAPLLPEPTATPHLLITSRVNQVGFDPVPIDRLGDEHSLELLASESRRSLEAPDDRAAALRIAQQLEGLPLALELAGAYLRRFPGVSWTAYADVLQREGVRARGLRDGAVASFTRHSPDLYATLHLHESTFEGSPLLKEALDVLAWSGSSSMGRDLLGALLGVGGSPELDLALGEGQSLRIIVQEEGPSPRFHLHRLVSEVRRAEVALQDHPERWAAILERVGDWFEERRKDYANLPSYEAEIDHLEAWEGRALQMHRTPNSPRLSST